MVWTPHQVITRLRPPRHTASTPRRPADQLDTSPLWFWDDEPPTTPRTDTRTLPIIIDQDGDPYPPVEREPRTRSHRTWRRGALLGAAAAALALLLFSGPVAGWLQHTPTAPAPGASTTNPNLAGGGSGSLFGAGPRNGPKTGGHHGHAAPGGAQPGPGLRAAPTPP